MPDQDVLKKRQGGGCLIPFGLPFLAAGLVVMTGPLNLVKWQGNPPPWPVAIPFGGVFALVGACLVFGRRVLTIDKTLGKAISRWQLIVPVKTTVRDLSEFDRVTLTKEVRRSKNSTYTVYPVRLEGEGDPFPWEEFRDPLKGRRAAERLAKFVGVKMVDRSTGGEVVRELEELDLSLRERLRAKGVAVEVPDPPPNVRTQCRVEGDELTLFIPPQGLTLLLKARLAFGFAPAIMGLVFLTAAYVQVFDKAPLPVKLGFFGFVGVFFVLLPVIFISGGALAAARRSQRVQVSPRRLRVETRGLFGSKVVEIPADELEELHAPAAGNLSTEALQQAPEPLGKLVTELASAAAARTAIRAVSDNAIAVIGKGLPPQELQWIHAVMLNVLTA